MIFCPFCVKLHPIVPRGLNKVMRKMEEDKGKILTLCDTCSRKCGVASYFVQGRNEVLKRVVLNMDALG